MGFIRTLARAAILWGQENALDVLSAVVLPCTNSAVTRMLGRTPSRWITRNLWNVRTVDGAILGGLAPAQSGAKYTLPKGLPKASSRVLAIENEPHTVDGFNGVIASGYGKGTKTLLADETVAVKIGTKMFLSRMNYHFHEADKAGPHFDLVVADVPPGTTQWELNIPRGDYKGRYAFIQTAKGTLVVPMVEEGALLPKPDYKLLAEEALKGLDPTQVILERKMDGSLGNCVIREGRAFFRSHRDTGQVYFDRIPAVERLSNTSRVWSFRMLMPYPDQKGTVLQGELVHPDGAARVSGILNALPDRAQATQKTRGPVEFYGWDIQKYRGRDVSHLPYHERRRLLESVIDEIRPFNKNWHTVEAMKPGQDPTEFYNRIINDPRGLPWSEGIVVKNRFAPAGELWPKIKRHDLLDLEILPDGFAEGHGKYAGTLGALTVMDPKTGSIGEVGSGFSDYERDWIWQHQDSLNGAVIKVKVMEETGKSFRAPVFHSFHEGKGNTEAGLIMYAESLAGLDPEEIMRTKYKLISSAGWKR